MTILAAEPFVRDARHERPKYSKCGEGGHCCLEYLLSLLMVSDVYYVPRRSNLADDTLSIVPQYLSTQVGPHADDGRRQTRSYTYTVRWKRQL